MFMARWELVRFGKTTRHLKQRALEQMTPQEIALRDAARKALKYPPLRNSHKTALPISVGRYQPPGVSPRFQVHNRE